MTEIWKDIEGYDHKYQVSNIGRVRSVEHIDKLNRKREGKILKQYIFPNGYARVNFCNYPDIYVHRAVAIAFVPGYFDGAEVNHKDENKLNNRADNLEWVTHSENCKYGSRNQKCIDYNNQYRAIPVEQYDLQGNLIATHPSIKAAARAISISDRAIHRVLNNQGTAKGYRFKTPLTPITNRTTNPITNRTDNPIDNRVPTPFGTHVK